MLDITNPVQARVKYYNGAWVDLSGQDADITGVLANQPTAVQAPELTTAKTSSEAHQVQQMVFLF